MEIKDISEIQYASYNPRILSDHMGNSLDASLTTFGDISGVTSNVLSNTYITGHQRLKVLEARYPGRVKIYIEHKFDAPDEYGTVATGFVGVQGTNLHLSYRAVSWDIGKEKAANVSANKVSATFDDQMLAELDYDLSQLENGDDLLKLTGQSEKEIEKLLQQVGAGPEEDPPVEDENESNKLTFALSKDQKAIVEQALAQAKITNNIPHTNLDNINGTALYIISAKYLNDGMSQNVQTPPETIPQETPTQGISISESSSPETPASEPFLAPTTEYPTTPIAPSQDPQTDLTSIPS